MNLLQHKNNFIDYEYSIQKKRNLSRYYSMNPYEIKSFDKLVLFSSSRKKSRTNLQESFKPGFKGGILFDEVEHDHEFFIYGLFTDISHSHPQFLRNFIFDKKTRLPRQEVIERLSTLRGPFLFSFFTLFLNFEFLFSNEAIIRTVKRASNRSFTFYFYESKKYPQTYKTDQNDSFRLGLSIHTMYKNKELTYLYLNSIGFRKDPLGFINISKVS